MAGTDSYEAPGGSEVSDALERKPAHSAQLLEIHHREYTLRLYYRMMLKGYVVLSIAVGVASLTSSLVKFQPIAYMLMGAFIGALLRDFGTARQMKRTWKIQSKLLDWDKVKKMAGSEPLGE